MNATLTTTRPDADHPAPPPPDAAAIAAAVAAEARTAEGLAPDADLDEAAAHAAATEFLKRATAAEIQPTGRHVGAAATRSARWGRDRLKEFNTTLDGSRASDAAAAEPEKPQPRPAAETPAAAALPAHDAACSCGGCHQRAQTVRCLAVAAMILGIAASVAANVAHTLLIVMPTQADGGPGQVVLAGLWPLVLAVTAEIAIRTPWADNVISWCGRIAVGAVALGAAIISYGHMHDLLLHWSYDGLAAMVGPIVVDGGVIAGAMAMLTVGPPRKTQPDEEKKGAAEPTMEPRTA